MLSIVVRQDTLAAKQIMGAIMGAISPKPKTMAALTTKTALLKFEWVNCRHFDQP
jgi:hypothetical protein